MDKKILSAAIIAAMAAPVVAVADTTLYGQVHMSVGAVDDSMPAGTTNDNMQVRNHASRLGVKGSEDLGGGLKANFMLEWGVNPDDGTDAGFTRRNQWVGLSGDSWGEVRVGRHDTPLKIAQGGFDMFNDTDADIDGIIGISEGEQRADNTILYLSPSFSGFSFAGAGIAGEENPANSGVNDDDTGLTDVYSLAAMYSNGPLFASLAYNDYDYDDSTSDNSLGSVHDNIWRGVVTYKFGDATIGGLYEGTEFGSIAGVSAEKDVWGLSGKYSLGNVDLKAQYMSGSTDFGVGGVDDSEQDQWSLGADYNFSKRTTAYVMYTSAEDDQLPSVITTTDDRDYDYAAVGMIHKF